MPHPARRAFALAAVLSLAACDGDRVCLTYPATIVVSAERVASPAGTAVPLEATVTPGGCGDAPRQLLWQSGDSTVFQLDTVTTAPHRVTGRALQAGNTTVTVSGDGNRYVLPVEIRPQAGAAR